MLRVPQRKLLQYFSARRRTVRISLEKEADVGTLVSALHRLRRVAVKSLSLRRVDTFAIVEPDLEPGPGVSLDLDLAELADRDDVQGIEVS